VNDLHIDPGVQPAVGRQSTTRASWREAAARRGLFVVASLVALALLARWLTPAGNVSNSGHPPNAVQPVPVAATQAHTGDMPIVLKALGTVTPIATVTVQSQISGQIFNIAYREGQIIQRGDNLIQIDPRPYQVALEQAQGALERDRALLANARVDLARYQKLSAEDSIPEQTLATQKALVNQYEGTVATYRQTVLTAFQQVEDVLAALRILEQQYTVADQTVRSANEAVGLTLNEYKAGTVAYTAVVTAQAVALQDALSLATIRENRLVASVSLMQALGGGWTARSLGR